ncbi:prepilin peptidase [Vibrio sp.]|nr:prepilin peptidase [Vibrio sp.]
MTELNHNFLTSANDLALVLSVNINILSLVHFMVYFFLIYSILFLIVLSDLNFRIIPNKYLGLLIIGVLLLKFNYLDNGFFSIFSLDLLAATLFFLLGLTLYSLSAMAPGDVKFLFVYGFYVGWDGVLSGVYFLSISMVIIGCLYYIYFISFYSNMITEMKRLIISRGDGFFSSKFEEKYNGFFLFETKFYMPFAPVITFGLALHQYYLL